MTRRFLTFDCAGDMLVGTLDEAAGKTALLLVTGGNELRSGAWGGQARFAARIAAAGYSVLRFDRRGTGDSEGENLEFRNSDKDIEAALQTLREQCPQVSRVVGMGNCDAASALLLASGAGCDALILSNTWTYDAVEDDAPPASDEVRRHYRQRLADPAAIRRLLTGKVSISGLVGSLISALRPAPPPSTLVEEMKAGLSRFGGPVTWLVAERDRTGQAFLSAWDLSGAEVHRCPGATHSYVEPHAQDWLVERALAALRD
ncbi:hydrolase 1, exosortase A system-associated [Novosphingobium aquimarinum]|uniref:hydrolase 1, exosortase A system-associated n=1 Tax=Novosphingobium aquimarinum TaxID=2682494 RepID=UPI0012ECA1B3|nr:hydrolase 1, exosortase A system-associated [Novosphingobium aquimarinum]